MNLVFFMFQLEKLSYFLQIRNLNSEPKFKRNNTNLIYIN